MQSSWTPLTALGSESDMVIEKSYEDSTEATCDCSYDLGSFFAQARRVLKGIWPDVAEEDIRLTHVCGGDNNRVVGVSRHPVSLSYRDDAASRSRTAESYVLRVPNNPDDIESTAACFLFANRFTRIPVPETVHLDADSSNPFEEPFILQKRIPGMQAEIYLTRLNHAQKCRFARDLGWVYRELIETRHDEAGRVVLVPRNDRGPDVTSQVGVWTEEGTRAPPTEGYDPSTSAMAEVPAPAIRNALLGRLRDRKADSDSMGQGGTICRECRPLRDELLDKLIIVIEEMSAEGRFDDVGFALFHPDLHPCNILVNEDLDADPLITGVLDWDGASFVPMFDVAVPPTWLFCHNLAVDSDKQLVTGEELDYKRHFDDAAGEQFRRIAYGEDRLGMLQSQHPSSWCVCQTWGGEAVPNNESAATRTLIRAWAERRERVYGRPSAVDIGEDRETSG